MLFVDFTNLVPVAEHLILPGIRLCLFNFHDYHQPNAALEAVFFPKTAEVSNPVFLRRDNRPVRR